MLPALALVACSKLSQVGHLPQATVKASAATVGQPYTTDSSGVMHTTVRSGADVVLTGVNSETMPDDNGVPVITWKWSQVNPGNYPVDLIKRTTEASSFTAPQVTQSTTLTFQLTVTNANGVTDSTQALVVVEPVPDADHFLTFVNANDRYTVTAITSAAVPQTAGAAYNATVPFTITVTKLVTYTDNGGTQHTQVPVGQPMTYSGGWSQSLGSGGTSCSDPRNPQFQVPIPSLNLDDPLQDGSGMRLSDVMQASDVDIDPPNSQIPPAVVYAQVQITSSALQAGFSPGVCVAATSSFSNAAAPSTLISDRATLVNDANPTGGLFDTSDSTHAYYSTIDPTGSKSTLQSWLAANGFDMSQSNWGADAHAVYTNNYDLGLGRDMYLKANCPAGTPALSQMTPAQLYQAIGQCDVASVVVNYVGVQAAAEHTNSIVAVAMEYSAVAGGGTRFTKFYAFAPDQRSGQLQRVTSVDLDHRGQKYIPQACVVCHGGLPGTATSVGGAPQYSAGGNLPPGDVAAGFLPWDLASLLYSDTDPGFSQKAEDAALKAQYTQANQLSQFKLLNAGAYLTADDPNRFALLRELLEGWYGGQGLPGTSGNASAFNGTFVPAGWQGAPTNANANPAGSDTFYTDVFARACRACHVMQVPAQVNGQTANLSNGGAEGSGTTYCASTVTPNNLGAPDQFPIGCYWQFAKLPNLATYLSDARMPFARRTMDRLWVDSNGYPSAAGQELIATLSQPTVAVLPAGTTTVVGNPSFLTINTSGSEGFTGSSQSGGVLLLPPTIVTGWLTLAPTDLSLGQLVAQPSWQVCQVPSAAAAESCSGSTSEFAVVGSGTIPGTFEILSAGDFLIELDSAGNKVASVPFSIPNQPPQIQGLPTTMFPNQPLVIDLTSKVAPGNGPLADYTWWISGLSNLSVTPQGANNCMSQAQACSLLSPVTLTLTNSQATQANYTLEVADASQPANISSPAAETVSVTQLAANPLTGFVCAYDYLYAPGGPLAQGGAAAVLDSANSTPCSSSSAPTGSALDLSNGYQVGNNSGQTLKVVLQCSQGAQPTTSCADFPVTGATLTVNGTQLTYSVPTGFSTNATDGQCGSLGATCSPPTLQYQVQLYGSSNTLEAQSQWGMLTMQVRANVSFSTDVVTGVFQASPNPKAWPSGLASPTYDCAECHISGNPPVDGLAFQTPETASSIYTQLCGTGTGASCNASSTYTGITGRFVDPAAVVTDSILLLHPANILVGGNTTDHSSGGDRCSGGFTQANPPAPVTPSSCDMKNVLLWIEDGANKF